MSIAIWIGIALVCFVMPAVALTNGGKKAPGRDALAKYAQQTGLPLTDTVAGPVIDRIRRRERGMFIGGTAAIVVSGLASILVDDHSTWGALVLALAGAGTVFGGAWAMAKYQPEPTTDRPVVARLRSTQLADYLAKGERFGLWVAPVAALVGVLPGILLFQQLPAEVRGASVTIGLIGTGVALVAWTVTQVVLRRVLAAPARSGSDLELAWDDAERAFGLRQLANLAVLVCCIALGFWLILMALSLTSTGFYRQPDAMPLTYTLTFGSLAVFGVLLAVAAAGPIQSWLSGESRGYEQRRLWPNGVSIS